MSIQSLTNIFQTAKLPEAVTAEHIKSRIVDTRYIQVEGTTLTICILTLDNGFNVRGESACVNPAMYNQVKGENYAYEDAFSKLWPLMGFLLAEDRYRLTRAVEILEAHRELGSSTTH